MVFEHQRFRLHDPLPRRGGGSIPLDEGLYGKLLRLNDQQPTRFLEAGHRSLRFLSRVGVVQCGGVTFEILPKADRASGDENAQGRWHGALVEMLCIARQVPLQRGQRGMLELRQRDLLSVFLLLFLDEVEQLQREGLARSYRDHEANLPQFRGRLLVKEQLRQNLVHRERFYTSHALFDADNPANLTLRDALVAVSRCASDGDLADRSRRLLASFPELGKSRRRPVVATHSRSLARYQDALTLARWILEHFTPAATSGEEHAFVYLVEMNVLFQELVAAMFKRLVPSGLQVASQARRAFWPEEEVVRRGLRPDLVISGASGTFVLDTKWKTHGRSAPSDEDLRQVYVYCQYFSTQRGVLLYPKTDDGPVERMGTFVRREPGTPEGAVRCELRYLTLFNSEGDFDKEEIRRQLHQLSGLP